MSRLAAVLGKLRPPAPEKPSKKRKVQAANGISDQKDVRGAKKALAEAAIAPAASDEDDGVPDASGAYDELVGLLSRQDNPMAAALRRRQHQEGGESGESSDDSEVRTAAAPLCDTTICSQQAVNVTSLHAALAAML
jgi:hypothetical protein